MQDFDYSQFANSEQSQQQGPADENGFDYSNFSDANVPQKQDNTSAFMAGVAGFNESVGSLSAGILKLVAPSGSWLERNINQSRESFKAASTQAAQAHPIANMLGTLSGDVAQAIPAMMAGGPSFIGQATAGAFLGGAQDSADRPMNAVLGAVLGSAGAGIAKGVEKIASYGPKASAARFAAETPIKTDVLQAGKELGVEISPIEASTSINLRSAPGAKINMNTTKMGELQGKLIDRETKLQGAIQDIKQSVLKDADGNPMDLETAKELKNNLYSNLNPKQIAEDKLTDITPQMGSDKLTFAQKLYEEAHGPNSGLNFDNVTRGSFEDIYKTRQYINDKMKTLDTSLGTAANQGKSSGKKGAASLDLREAKNKFTEALKSVDTEGQLAQAESLAKKVGFVEKMDLDISKAGISSPFFDVPTSQDIYKKIFSTPEKQKAFIAKVTKLGGDGKQAANMVRVLKTLHESPVEGLLGKNPYSGKSVSNATLGKLGGAAYLFGPGATVTGFGASVGVGKLASDFWYKQLFRELPKSGSNVPKYIARVAETAAPVGATELRD